MLWDLRHLLSINQPYGYNITTSTRNITAPNYKFLPLKTFPESYQLVVDLPGYNKEDVQVLATSDLNLELKVKENRFYIPIPTDYEVEGTATLKNGQLLLSLVKSKSAVKKIPIE